MDFEGRIIAVLEKKSGLSKNTGNPWAKQDYVIEETSGDYPKKMVFEVFGDDKIEQFAIKKGEQLRVSFNVDANEYQGKYYNSIKGWKVERLGGTTTAPKQSNRDNSIDDIPF